MTNPVSNRRNITARYSSLPLVSLLLKMLAFLLLGFSVAIFLYGIYYMITQKAGAALGAFLGQLLGGIVVSLLLLAASELIHVIMDIEENTRRAADAATGEVTGTTPKADRA